MNNALRVGIPIIGGKGWLGGIAYIEVLVKALNMLPDEERPNIALVVTESTAQELELHRHILPFIDVLYFVGNSTGITIEHKDNIRFFRSFSELDEIVDFYFPANSTVLSEVCSGSWIPDFQHIYLPQFFSTEDLANRDAQFRAIAEQASLAVFSSKDAEKDFHKLFPSSQVLTRVLSFHSLPEEDWYAFDPVAVQQAYNLPDRFFICCNQFWVHKNHQLLLEAFSRIVNTEDRIHLVCTGATTDYRNETYFLSLQKLVERLGISSRVHILGTIPRCDQIQLMRRALAVIQPSLFEGWSTVVEDARALGKIIILSDLPVNYEQAPDHAYYFDRNNAFSLQTAIGAVLSGLNPGPDSEQESHARTHSKALALAFARQFCLIAREAHEQYYSRKQYTTLSPFKAETFPRNETSTICIATSIVPGNVEIQKQAVDSWKKMGCRIISVNSKTEILQLTHSFPEVQFVESHRNAASLAGKPLIYIDDILVALEESGASICGVVNSDIILDAFEGFFEFLEREARDTLVFGARTDVATALDRKGEEFAVGLDYFFFYKGLIDAFKGTDFCLGAPWWDYWMPLAPLMYDMPVKQLVSPVAFHCKHATKWAGTLWESFGDSFLGLLFSNKFDAAHKNSLFADLKELGFSGDRYSFAVAVLEYIKQKAKKIYYPVTEIANMPLVSAIVSTYNSESFMRGCLEDLTSQSLFVKGLMEIIVVDSASPQQEEKIVKDFQARYPNINYIRTDQRETIYQAWNRGIKAAQGKYITNANTDDRHRSDALEVLAAVLEAHPEVALAYADVFVTNLPNQTFSEHVRCGYHIRPEYAPEIMLSGCHMGPQPMWRKDIHDRIGLFHEELRSAGDYEFWCRIALHTPLLHVPEFLGLYYENPKGFCNADMELSSQETVLIKQAYNGRFPNPLRSFTNNLQYAGPAEAGSFVNIGMITYNRLEFTRKAIKALVLNTDFPHVITVIDNASVDGTREYLLEQKQKGIIKNLVLLDENIGVAKASNIAWSLEPGAGYYLKLDNDIVIQKHGWLSAMVYILDDTPQIGALAYSFEPTSYPLHMVNGHAVRLKNGNLGGACFLIPARTRERIGCWCEDYGLYSEEDFDFCYRMFLAGIQYAYMEDEDIGFHLPAGKAAKIDEKSLEATDGIEEERQQGYRLWKDEIRRQALRSGLRDRNLLAYKSGAKPLYVESQAVRDWNGPGNPGLVAPDGAGAGAPSRKHVLGGSRLVNHWLDGLRGLEIGASALNAFGLNARNVGMRDNIYEEEQVRHVGTVAPIHIEALADNIPVADESEDFVFSSHVIEHCPDFIGTLLEWFRIVKKNGIIYMIVPLRNAAPSDVGRPLTEWGHMLSDFVNQADGLSEPEAGQLGHCHYHVFDIDRMKSFVAEIFGARLELVGHQDVDDKIGNGFALVYRKTAALSESSPWPYWERFASRRAKKNKDTGKMVNTSTTITSPSISSSLNIAVFSHDDSSHACGYYRLYSPSQALWPDAEFRWPVRTEGGSFKIDLQGLDKSDLFVIQRFFPHKMSAPVIKQLMAMGKPVVFELDDYITAIPPSNPGYEWAQQCRAHIEECIKECDAVTVSTDALREVFSCLNPAIFVLPNLIDEALWERPFPPSGDGRIIIGFTGTNTHVADIAFLEETLERIASAHPGKVAFTFMGCATERLARLPGFKFIPFETTYQAYARTLQQVPIDIALVPLEDNPFNRCKSNVKWLEYSVCGVAGIYADLRPYNTTVEHGVTGVLVGSDPQQWFNAIDLLIRNQELRRSIALSARRKVLSEYTIKRGAHRWLDVYRQVIAAHGETSQRRPVATTTSSSASVAASGSNALVSIIVPLFNQVDFTRRCLEGLAQTIGDSISCEIILVDNGSTDATGEYLGSLGNSVSIIRNSSNQGFARACNQGARAAVGTYLLFLNNDTVPQPGWLGPLIKVLEDDPSVAATGSKLLYPDGTIQHAGVIMVDNRAGNDPLCGEHIWHGKPAAQPEANQPYRYQALTAACLLIRRTAFEAVQGFNEEYWNGYEDVDLCFKLGQQGWKLVYQPQSVVIHHESKSGPERFSRVAGNIELLHRTWLGRVTPDIVIQANGRVEQTGSTIGPYGPVGAQPAPKVSIVIPLYNQAQLTKACVEAVRATAGDPKRYEVILVDNGSRDWTREYVKSLGDSVTVITNSDNLGFARACNQGAQAAKGKYLLFLNNDTVPRAGWLDALLAGAAEDGADIVGGKLLYPNGRVQHAGVAFNKNGIGYHIFRNFPAGAPAVNKKRLMQCVTAACLLVTRQLFLELGGFDEQYRNGFEDVDFCLRAGQSGRRVLYTPHAVVVHHEEQSEGRKQCDAQNMQRYLMLWRGKVRCDDEDLYNAEGFSVEWHGDGSCTIRQRSAEAAPAAGTYPLVPLVGSYAETPLARLSASARMKAVLKAYSGGSGVRDVPIL